MAPQYFGLALLFFNVILLAQSTVEGSWLLGAERPGEEDEFNVKDIKERKLVNAKDGLEAVEKELARRSEVKDLYEELKQVNLQNKKRQIRHTPKPEVKRLKMTPPPNVPAGIVRYDKTPPVPAKIQPRPTPLPYPYNLIDKPLKQTPRPLRFTPVPPNKPFGYPAELVQPVERGTYEEALEQQERNLWRQMYRRRLLARRAYEERNRREEDYGPYLSVGFIGHRAQERGGFYN